MESSERSLEGALPKLNKCKQGERGSIFWSFYYKVIIKSLLKVTKFLVRRSTMEDIMPLKLDVGPKGGIKERSFVGGRDCQNRASANRGGLGVQILVIS